MSAEGLQRQGSGADQFEAAGETASGLLPSDPRGPEFVARFSDALLAAKRIDGAAIERARRAQAQSGERFDVVLSRLGLLSETQVCEALATYFGERVATEGDFPAAAILPDRLPLSFLKSSRMVPLSVSAAGADIARADPFNRDCVDAVAFLLKVPVTTRLATSGVIDAALERLYTKAEATGPTKRPLAIVASNVSTISTDDGDRDIRRLEDMASEAPVIKLVQDLIVRAVDANASDIHIEPGEDALRVRFRIDGILHTIETLEPALRQSLSSRIKVLSQLNIAERRMPQDGRTSVAVRGRDVDLRVSTMPTIYGESVVLRILDRSSVSLDAAQLGLIGPNIERFWRDVSRPNGLILVTGPTGSGKTTTLYTALSRLNDPARKVFTVEDPIEYQLGGVNQIQVNTKIGLTFAHALRSMLRQDPDVVMVGEIRDVETADIAIQASLTGHLVLSTLHTNSAVSTVTRLLNMGVEGYLLASSLKGVLAQRLVRRLCPSCAIGDDEGARLVAGIMQASSVQHELRQGVHHHVHNQTHDTVHDEKRSDVACGVKRAVGCTSCRGTGYAGRTTIYEYLHVGEAVEAAILERRSEAALHATAQAQGMTAMMHQGLGKVLSGVTTYDEVLRVTRGEDGAV